MRSKPSLRLWKRSVSCLTAGLLLCGAAQLPGTARAVTTETDIYEDFQGFSTSAVFNTSSSTAYHWAANASANNWSVEADADEAANHFIRIGGQQSSTTLLYNKDFVGNNVAYSALVKSDTTAAAGITARYRDSSNYYWLSLNRDGKLSLGKRAAGANTTLKSAVIPGFDADRYYRLKLTVSGASLAGSAEGGPTLYVAEDTSLSEAPGGTAANRVGFFAAGGAAASFDDMYAVNVVPPAPTGLAAMAAVDGQISLGWNGTGGRYAVKRSSSPGGPYTMLATVSEASYTDLVPDGTAYSYVVSAVASAEDRPEAEGLPSGELTAASTASTVPPAAPAGLFAVVGLSQAALTWHASADVTAYRIKRSEQPGGPYETIGEVGAAALSYTDTGLIPGHIYYYAVAGVNAQGEGPLSAQVAASPSTPPDSPSAVTAVPGNGKVKVAWSPVNEAAGYTVKRSASPTGPFMPIAAGLNALALEDSGSLSNGTTYYYVVQAVNDSGVSSDDSAPASATPRSRYPLDPAGITASSDDGNKPQASADNKLSTRWGANGQGQWIQYDLGAASSIGYLGIAWYKGDVRSSRFHLDVSNDGLAWTRVYTGQSSGSSAGLEAVQLPDTEARYIKLTGEGNSATAYNGIQELQVYAPNPNGAVLEPVAEEPGSHAPTAVPYLKAGLYNADGTPHLLPQPNAVTGRTIDVAAEYGADPADGEDDRPAIQRAIDEAQPGDELYFPNGVYNLKTAAPGDANSNLVLKSGVNLRGESQEGTILISDFDNRAGSSLTGSNSRVMAAINKNGIVISNLTISSSWTGAYPTDTTVSSPERGGPKSGIYIDDSSSGTTNTNNEPHNIVVDHVTVEKYERLGVRISKAHDVVVQHSLFRNATDIGGGGAGYGVDIQGVFKEDRLGYYNDSRWNVVQNNLFDGTNALRHGALLQAYTHNNVVRDNTFTGTALDAIDLHGEDEYLNEVYGNTVTGVWHGGGIGVGNTGGSSPSNHDASGPYNYIHDNVIRNSLRGIQLMMGSPDTIVENNLIEFDPELEPTREFVTDDGIEVLNAPRTIIRNNVIRGFSGPSSRGIVVMRDAGDKNNGHVGAGDPADVWIAGNTVTGNRTGVQIDAGTGIVLEDNEIAGNIAADLLVNSAVQAVFDRQAAAAEDAWADRSRPDANFGAGDSNDAQNFRMTTSPDGTAASIAYYKFNVPAVGGIASAQLRLSGRLTDANPGDDAYRFDVYGLSDASWSESGLTWNASPNHAAGGTQVTGIGSTAVYLGSITVTGNTIQAYSLSSQELTDYVNGRRGGQASILVADTEGQNAEAELYSREKVYETLRPALMLQTSGQP
ncbi:Amylopullulanase precursor [Paenibacillus konkukensis]|uniref:Amylopullulanase n=1 Tax=Paenibacillus konkukensis TaxID=2020716 RepID=A0ABY4RJI5_9BACL|nr:discoidin domain-containing protein [Paenibacillus konkukensis]UQZ82632.1 Amylopullulanase precursor [Paenibacillus konkukensis]